jgi:hypothetical protein
MLLVVYGMCLHFASEQRSPTALKILLLNDDVPEVVVSGDA